MWILNSRRRLLDTKEEYLRLIKYKNRFRTKGFGLFMFLFCSGLRYDLFLKKNGKITDPHFNLRSCFGCDGIGGKLRLKEYSLFNILFR